GMDPETFRGGDKLLFGTYSYVNDRMDQTAIREVIRKGESLLHDTTINGERVLESFVPISPVNKGPYVIRIVSSYEPISSVISKQMFSQVTISLVLLQIVIFASYILAGEIIRPIQDILIKVNQL